MRNNNVSRKDRLKSKRRAPANYLIVCEGKKTEPNYFNGLKKKINEKYGNKVDVLIPNIEVKGTGKNTTDLVKYTQKYVNYSSKVYGQVWVVFDKDDYNDEQFNKAIENCDYNACWSNPNFELWLLAHLKKVTRYISKDDILELYVNTIYFGDGYYGIKEACNGYLDKEPQDMTLYEATMMAGIPNAPSIYSEDDKLGEERRLQVVEAMEKYN